MENHWGSKIDDPSSSWDYENAKTVSNGFCIRRHAGIHTSRRKFSAASWESDDFAFIGGLRDMPVEMVKCETIDVDVPANAEIVVEGEFRTVQLGDPGAVCVVQRFLRCTETPPRVRCHRDNDAQESNFSTRAHWTSLERMQFHRRIFPLRSNVPADPGNHAKCC